MIAKSHPSLLLSTSVSRRTPFEAVLRRRLREALPLSWNGKLCHSCRCVPRSDKITKKLQGKPDCLDVASQLHKWSPNRVQVIRASSPAPILITPSPENAAIYSYMQEILEMLEYFPYLLFSIELYYAHHDQSQSSNHDVWAVYVDQHCTWQRSISAGRQIVWRRGWFRLHIVYQSNVSNVSTDFQRRICRDLW